MGAPVAAGRWASIVVGCVVVATGCQKDPRDLAWEIELADRGARERIAGFVLEIRSGSCAGEPEFGVSVRAGEEPARRPDRLPPGRYGFAAAALDAECGVVAFGCEPAELPLDPGSVVRVRLEAGDGFACELDACDDGVCAEPGDAGVPDDGCVPAPETCNEIDDDCDGEVDEETDRLSDPLHCGECGNRCAAPTGGTAACVGGECAAECDAGRADCNGDPGDGCETDVTVPEACGGCERPCPDATPLCSVGADGAECVAECPADRTRCGASCVDTRTHPSHCGSCDIACAPAHATPSCAEGRCGVAACEPGFGDCNGVPRDGCETDTDTSAMHCGACGASCPEDGARCVDGVCRATECTGSLADCDGDPGGTCETDTATSVEHCGGCGARCAPPFATGECVGGACGVDVCSALRGDCNGDPTDGCEVSLSGNPDHCGACAAACDECETCLGTTCIPSSVGGACAGGAGRCTSTGCCTGCVQVLSCMTGDTEDACGSGGGACERCGDCERCGPSGCEPVADGDACAGGACRGGACCTGCWDGERCRAGSTDAACGSGGAVCEACACAGDDCRGGACDPGEGLVVAITAGGRHTCAITAFREAVVCWGANEAGQLGDGTTLSRSTPRGLEGTRDDNYTSITAGAEHTCGTRADTLQCWGGNAVGQLGLGLGAPGRALAPMTSDSPWGPRPASAGARHTCGVDSGEAAERLECWGSNVAGQLGLGTTGGFEVDQERVLMGDFQVSAGDSHTCILGAGGAPLSCFGSDEHGQLGNGFGVGDVSAPGTITGDPGSEWAMVSAGGSHTCAVLASGDLRCWGRNLEGQVGDGTMTSRQTPHAVADGTSWRVVAAGGAHTCGIQTDGSLWCWGDNGSGQLGDGTTTSRNVPTRVGSRTDWEAVATGDSHTCAIAVGAVYCWGDNTAGQAGVPARDEVLLPTRVCIDAG